jgi:poly-gamma-glutamate synthesis protein (capsule biosynthesis protein)
MIKTSEKFRTYFFKFSITLPLLVTLSLLSTTSSAKAELPLIEPGLLDKGSNQKDFNKSIDPSQEITISFSGDILTHTSLYKKAYNGKEYNFKPFFSKIKPLLSSDLDICHLETPLVKRNFSGYPVFRTPTELISAIKWAGFEGCSLASNHSLDAGVEGLSSTLEQFRLNKLLSSGTTDKLEDLSDVATYLIQGRKISHLSYTWSLNGIKLPKPHLVNYPISVSAIKKEALSLRENGSDLVILSLHFGNEYQVKPSSYQKDIVKKILKVADIDAIIGHHAHVVQPSEIIYEKPVYFGLGNLWSAQGPWSNDPRTQWGVILYLTFKFDQGKPYLSASYTTPTIVIPGSWQIYPARSVLLEKWLKQSEFALKESQRLIIPFKK